MSAASSLRLIAQRVLFFLLLVPVAWAQTPPARPPQNDPVRAREEERRRARAEFEEFVLVAQQAYDLGDCNRAIVACDRAVKAAAWFTSVPSTPSAGPNQLGRNTAPSAFLIWQHCLASECRWQLGEVAEALQENDAALQRLVSEPTLFHSSIYSEPDGRERRRMRPPTWGPGQRLAGPGAFNGISQEAPTFSLTRLTASLGLSLIRRREILGGQAPFDTLLEELRARLEQGLFPAGHWSLAWNGVLLGLTNSAIGEDVRAVAELSRSLQVAGLDHPLTSVALLELGHIAWRQRRADDAATFYLEASISAANHLQPDIVEESLLAGLRVHLLTRPGTPYGPLGPAADWAGRDFLRARASLRIAQAENALTLIDPARPLAAEALEEVRRLFARTGVASGRIGTRLQHQSALLAVQSENLAAARNALTQALALQKKRARLATQLVASAQRPLAPRPALERLASLLHDPTPTDWHDDPLEAAERLAHRPLIGMEDWFRFSRREQAVEVADRIRRQRFGATLAFGGRLTDLRWILAGPETALSRAALQQRADLRQRFPRFAELARESEAIRLALALLPLFPAQTAEADEQRGLFERLAAVSVKQELLLVEIALRREPSEPAFPPLRPLAQIQAALPPRTLVMTWLGTRVGVFGLAFDRSRVFQSQIENPSAVRNDLGEWLGSWGLDRPRAVPAAILQAHDAPVVARRLAAQLLRPANYPPLANYDEIVFVPDGVLWYVPFEALPVDAAGTPLIRNVRVRYAPLASLAVPDGRPRVRSSTAVVDAGSLFPGVAADDLAPLVDRLLKEANGTHRLPERHAIPSGLFRAACDGVIVMRDLGPTPAVPYDWSLLAAGQDKFGGVLDHWGRLPWGGPDFVLLPGFHTPCETALRTSGTGQEVFLLLCGLMSAGARTVLLSRWRTGGASCYELTTELAKELPQVPAAAAWQRSVRLAEVSPIDLPREPRVEAARLENDMTTRHPFFWSGYLLADTGSVPVTE